MEIGSRSAQRFYGQALDVSQPAPQGGGVVGGAAETAIGAEALSGGGASQGPSFSETVGELAQDAIDSLRAGEQAAEAMMAGKADPHSVVEALAQTEMALEMAVTVRDRVVEAYQEILRMPV